MSATDWSDIDMGELLPTGTVTLLLADVAGSTRLWETEPQAMTAAMALLDRTFSEFISAHGGVRGVRPAEQGEGVSFGAAFARASDAIACALDLQRAPLAPIRLRIGVHTGEAQSRHEGNYADPAINKTARLRDLAHGGQSVLSAATEELVADCLPEDAWLIALGTHPLRDLPRPVRVAQLCHPDLCNDFPPLRASNGAAAQNLPSQLTSFIGRGVQITEIRAILSDNRLVTLTGAGGVGKTRLAIEVAGEMMTAFPGGIWYADLATITDPAVVSLVVARALGLPDQPGRSIRETLIRFVRDRRMLLVLDNCEHLLEECAALVNDLLATCVKTTILATSREPLVVAGEMIWQVPSLTLADEAIELFSDRARRARRDFAVTDGNSVTVTEICRRLDGMPLAIELAAARIRTLSLDEVVGSLHDRFRLLTGGARTAVRRQQTLRASVDWSHALLTEPERVLFRRLAVFMGGFDLDAARAVAGGTEVERYQVLDQLSLLIDKSLVVAEHTGRRTRYRLLETVRQYAMEKLGESGEADQVRNRHRDHYTAIGALLDAPASAGLDQPRQQAEAEIDNMRAAFAWSRENCDVDAALRLASSMQLLWLAGRYHEGLAWFEEFLAEGDRADVDQAVLSRALSDKAVLEAWTGGQHGVQRAERAIAIARDLDDPALLIRALTAHGTVAAHSAEAARRSLAEAGELARAVGDEWRLSETLAWQAYSAFIAGDPIAARTAGEEGRELADEIGDQFHSRQCRTWRAWAQMMQGNLIEAGDQFSELVAEADAAHDLIWKITALASEGHVLAYRGDATAALAKANATIDAAMNLGGIFAGIGRWALAYAALAADHPAMAVDASEAAWQQGSHQREAARTIFVDMMAQAALARGDLIAAKRWADDAVSVTAGWRLAVALTTRARMAIAQGNHDEAEHDAREALVCACEVQAYLAVCDILECMAALSSHRDRYPEAGRLFGAADAIRHRMSATRFKVHDAAYTLWVTAVREALGDGDFETAWAEGAALSTDEAIAYARRGRGERNRPSTGWGSLTPAELDVVRLVGEGLPNKDIAIRLFVSPRTVQSHLRHVYNKLGHTSRVQLAQEASRRARPTPAN